MREACEGRLSVFSFHFDRIFPFWKGFVVGFCGVWCCKILVYRTVSVSVVLWHGFGCFVVGKRG